MEGIEQLTTAFAEIEKHELKVNTIICTACGCVLSVNDDNKPCEHLRELGKAFELKD